MSTKQYDNTIKEYFNNNNKGFNAPYEVSFPKLNIKVEVYSHNLKPNKIVQMKSDIEETVKNFQNISNLERSNSEKILKVYVFDDQADYKYLGNKFDFGLGNEGGKTYYKGEQDVFAEMYVYQAGGIHNFKHELAHGLTYVATEGKSLPTILMEGIADYIEHSSDQNFNTQEGFSIDEAERAIGKRGLDLNSILKLQYSEDAADNSLVYKMGHALTMYLKDKGILEDYLGAMKKGNGGYAESLIHRHYDQGDFANWLSQHNTETAMKEMNALQVTKGEFIGTKEEIVDGEIKNVSYYKANIEKMSGENVGQFSTTSYYFTNDYLRVENSATRYHLDLSEQYSFIKLVSRNGEMKLTYCDKYGNEYKGSDQYKSHITQAVAYYEGTLQESMMEELTYFDPNQVRATNKSFTNFEYGKVYSVHSNGASSTKQANGISIYDGNNKIGELLTEAGFFKSVEGSSKEAFFFTDDLMGIYTKYDDGAYIAVTKENGEFKASLIDGRAVSKDDYYDKPHLHRNELLEPSINHINKGEINNSLLLKGTEILDHSESEAAKVHTVVKRGALLDNKGTERTDDDVYEAKIEQGDFMYTFQNKGFYISTKGDLFIEDHGKGVRYQLPQEITHLKLVEKNGIKKLVPVTKDGNEHIYDSRDNIIPDEYRYIDPIFAHEYEKKDYSHKHVNIGLINFDKYKPGTMFEMKYDPNDYQIPRDANGNVVKLKHQSYFTKVKLFDEHDQEIGMLSDNFHNYTDKIFFSVDYNYSYNDFLASVAPQVNTKDQFNEESGKWTKVITFDQGKGDIGGTDRGYTDHQKIYVPQDQKTQSYYHSDEQMQGDQPLAYAQSRTQINNHRDYNTRYDNGQNSGARGKRTVDESDYSSKQKHINSITQPETQKPIVLNFSVEMDKEIGQHQLVLTEDSKKLARDAFGDKVQFSNLDLPENFSVWYNKYGGNRYEVRVEDDNGRVSNHPIDYYGLSVEISADGSKVLDHGIYPLAVIHNPDHYNKAQYKDPSGLDGSKFLKDIENNLLSIQTPHDASTKMYADEGAKVNMFAQMSSRIAQQRQKEEAEKAASLQKYEELKEHIKDGNIIFFKVVRGNDIGNGRSEAVLQLDEKSKKALGIDDLKITLNSGEFYIASDKNWYNNDSILYYKNHPNLPYHSYNFILNKDAPSDFKYLEGFYSGIGGNPDDFITYSSPEYKNNPGKHHFILDSNFRNKLISSLDVGKSNTDDKYMHNDQQVIDHTHKAQKQYDNSNNKQFSNKGAELKKAIKEGDIIIYRVKEKSSADGEHSSTTFKMIKKSKEVEANNEYQKSIKLNSKDFDIKKVTHKEGIEDGDKLFYVLNKNDPSESGFYNLGKEKIGFKALVKSLEDPKYKYSYHDDIDDKFSISGQDNHNQQYARYDEQMPSDQPQAEKISHDKHNTEHEDIVLKDTILSVSKSDTADKHGRYKAEIKIERKDIESLYNKSSGEEQQYVLKFWHVLAKNHYKIGDLPGGKYYFKGDKFIIQDKQQGKSIKLPEEKISVQLMHLKDHQGKDHLELVVLNKVDGKVIGNVHEINNLSYELLRSDSDILSHLEIQGHDITIHSNDYDTYLTHGLDSHILGNHHGGDHALI